MDERIMTRDLPTSGKPAAPPPRPSPEATWDLAWRYGRDVARLHMVDPEKLFFFWEVTDETAGRRAAGRAGKLSARLVKIDGGLERAVTTAEGVFAVMNWYFDVEPLASYRGEIGWLNPDGSFEAWLVSNVIETPRLSVNVTGEVVWRTGGKKRGTRSAPRGHDALGLEHPSERPHDAASAAGARRRQAIREIARQAWSGSVTAWSRTAMALHGGPPPAAPAPPPPPPPSPPRRDEK